MAEVAGLIKPVVQRLARRRAAASQSDLLLVLHGRAGGVIPAEIQELAANVQSQRGGRVFLQALTDGEAASQAQAHPPAPITLVPLFQLPGHHVRSDIPAIANHWRRHGWPLRRLPFLGAWPQWQSGIAAALQQARLQGLKPLLLHHPLSEKLGLRYIKQQEQFFQASCEPWHDLVQLYIDQREPQLLVPLAIAANRLSEALSGMDWPATVQLWPPLLQQQQFHLLLQKQLISLA